MGILTDDMQRVVEEQRLGFVATVCADGTPNLSPKGTTAVWDDDHLVFADIASPQTLRNLAANPAVEINVVDQIGRRGFRFKGEAEILRDGEIFEFIKNDIRSREGPKVPVSAVVKVRVRQARPLLSPAYTLNPGITEAEVRTVWMARYGYRPAE